MAPLLRQPAGNSLSAGSALNTSLPRRPVTCTLVSHENPHGDCSFLLIRERPGLVPSGERLVLRGDFGMSARGHLASLLASVPAADKPLQIDLRRVTTLDRGCLALLLKAQRAHAPRRSVVFQVAEAGPVRAMICCLGLGQRLGVDESPVAVSQTGATLAALLPGPRPKTAAASAAVLPA